MIQKIINDYIQKLTIKDINEYLIKQNINLDDKELAILYKHVKEDWYTFIYGNQNQILDDLKSNINPNSFYKLYNLYLEQMKKYKNYL